MSVARLEEDEAMKKLMRTLLAAAAATLLAVSTAEAAELRGSLSSMRKQHQIAASNDYAFVATSRQVSAEVENGDLEPVVSTEDYVLHDVSFPYARPEVKLFIERLGAQYHDELGSAMVVTSLLRPTRSQPSNAHRLSVHPAGMAVDLRVPADATQRGWLERTLLALESSGVLDVTREHNPPHYHVAIYPAAYRAYVAKLDSVKPAPVVVQAATVPDEAEAQLDEPAAYLRPLLAFGFALLAVIGVFGTDIRVKRLWPRRFVRGA
jgi:hypothetical protein